MGKDNWQEVDGEIEQYKCIDCAHFSWCNITGEAYCYHRDCYIDDANDACNCFEFDFSL